MMRMAHFILKCLLAFSILFVALTAASSENHTTTNVNITSIVTAIDTFFDTSANILYSLIRIVFGVLTLVLFLILVRWIKQDDYETLILPFKIIKSEDKYDGNAIADLLIAELQRIKQINSTKYEGIENEELSMPPQKLSGETASIPQLGTVGTGSASISIGEMMITIKQLCRDGNRGQIITGSLEDCGSKIKLVAYLRGDRSCTCEAQTKTDKEIQSNSLDDFDLRPTNGSEDNFISDLVRDLSFKIAYNLSQDSISAKTLLGFKYYTEALASYQQYMMTKETNYLDLASENCIKAGDIEQNYSKLFGLFFYLGVAYYNEKKYDKTDKMFGKALDVDPKSAAVWANRANIFFKLGKIDYALEAANKALELNPDDEVATVALTNKAGVLLALNEYGEALKAANKALDLNPDDAIASVAWTNKASILFLLKNLDDELLTATKKIIELNQDKAHVAAAWTYKAYVLLKIDDGNEALAAAKNALDLNPKKVISVLAWHAKSDALRKINHDKEADIAFAKAKELELELESSLMIQA